jgi:hypothetical protein
MARLTFTIPDELVLELDTLSSVMGCTVSALVNLIVTERLEHFQDHLLFQQESLPEPPILKRARGDSLEDLEQRYKDFLHEFDRHNQD